jgi:pilus assembly protein Flp/PilA
VTGRAAQKTSRVHVPGNCVFLNEKGNPMQKFFKSVVNFVKAEDGPTAVEYAVMLALIIVVCITAITTLGTKANATFNTVSNQLGAAGS